MEDGQMDQCPVPIFHQTDLKYIRVGQHEAVSWANLGGGPVPLPGKLGSPEPIKMMKSYKTYGAIWVRGQNKIKTAKGLAE